jgi:hypothetical protein
MSNIWVETMSYHMKHASQISFGARACNSILFFYVQVIQSFYKANVTVLTNHYNIYIYIYFF